MTLLIQATFTGHVTFRPAENFNNLTNPKWRHIACEQALLLEKSKKVCTHAFALAMGGHTAPVKFPTITVKSWSSNF